MFEWIMDQGPGLLIGGAIGWLIAWTFARASSRETRAVWRSINMIARGIEAGGIARFAYDSEGNVTGAHLYGQAFGGSESRMSATLTPSPPRPTPVYDRQHDNPDPE